MKKYAIDKVVDDSLIYTTIQNAPPVILKKAIQNGRLTFIMKIPATIDVRSASDSSKAQRQDVTITLTIIRSPTVENPYGLAIQSLQLG